MKRWRALIAAAAAVALAAVAAEAGLRMTMAETYAPLFEAAAREPGFAPRPDWKGGLRVAGRDTRVTTDAGGQRVVPGAPARLPPERTIYLLGDSQVFGWGLNDDETIAASLQRRLGGSFRVVATGGPGQGPRAYQRELARLPGGSTAVVVQTESNDFWDVAEKGSQAAVRCHRLAGPASLLASLPCPLQSSRLLQAIAGLGARVGEPYSAVPLGYDPEAKTLAAVMRYRVARLYEAELRDRHGPVIFTVVPWDAAIDPTRLPGYRPRIASVQRHSGFQDDCAMTKAFRASARPEALFLPADTHLSASGADLAAAVIQHCLEAGDNLRKKRQG